MQPTLPTMPTIPADELLPPTMPTTPPLTDCPPPLEQNACEVPHWFAEVRADINSSLNDIAVTIVTEHPDSAIAQKASEVIVGTMDLLNRVEARPIQDELDKIRESVPLLSGAVDLAESLVEKLNVPCIPSLESPDKGRGG
ncbi:MAG: hypothetical protein IT567_05620 [Alphaproteobacteria bacterium]|nr:hypothetical protein [Alphaproteobacteria bacterium]